MQHFYSTLNILPPLAPFFFKNCLKYHMKKITKYYWKNTPIVNNDNFKNLNFILSEMDSVKNAKLLIIKPLN